ncbi:hypothetical protein [Christiangramia portivictoriae]|uniref:hypothetical protein n=1 Tax=Christiangramia portivictoriae TaxID=326069 RepID=UPI000412C766|nr:hypothetical protein [Christiangramia portivictoriae]
MRYETAYFDGLTQIQGLEKLLKVSFVKEAFLKTILDNDSEGWFRLVNHREYCLTLSNEKYVIFILIELNEFILKEIREAMENMDQYIPVVVKLEVESRTYGFPWEVDLKAEDICSTAKKDGVAHNNLFLIFLRLLFGHKPY